VPPESEDPWLDRMLDIFWHGVAVESQGVKARTG
jgi:hypothetical protein